MKTQAEYYQQYKALDNEKLLYELRGVNAYFMFRDSDTNAPPKPGMLEQKRALEQLLKERGLKNPGMQFGDIFRGASPTEGSTPPPPGSLFGPPKAKGKSSFLDQKVDLEKEFLNKGIIQIVIGVILAFFGIGLSLDMKGFFFYGAIFGGIALIVVGIMNVSSYHKLK
ncbi:MAG: hypothetical protein AAFN10_00385 [Bacteroidota bacterium]